MMKLNCRFLNIAVMLGTLLLAATPLPCKQTCSGIFGLEATLERLSLGPPFVTVNSTPKAIRIPARHQVMKARGAQKL